MICKSQLIGASLENLSSDPSAGTRGRIWINTVSGISKVDDGSSIRSIVTTDNTQTLTNKTFLDSTFSIADNSDSTKIAQFQCSGITTATTRTFTLPDASTTIVGTGVSQTLSNKSFSDFLEVAEVATPSTPASGFGRLYFKSDGEAYRLNDAGSESKLLTSATTLSVTSKTFADSGYTATTSDNVILIDASGGAFTLNLFAASGNTGARLYIKKTDSSFNAVTIDANLTETIDGATTTTLNTQNEVVEIICDGTNWQIVSRKITSISTSYTPTLSSTTNVSLNTSYWKRVGNGIILELGVEWNGAGGAGTFTLSLPSGLSIDTTALPAIGNSTVKLGVGERYQDTSGEYRLMTVLLNSSTTLSFIGRDGTSPFAGTDFADQDSLQAEVFIPISGWKG